MEKLQENKAFKQLCKKHRIKAKNIIETAQKTFDLEDMLLHEQEVALVRTLAITIEKKYSVLIGQYFDSIHREGHGGAIDKITEQMFKDCFDLKRQSSMHPEFDQWSGSIMIEDRYRLSIQAGSFMMCIPKMVCKSPDDYSDYEVAIIDQTDNKFVQLGAFVDGVSEYEEVVGYKSMSEIVEIGNTFIQKLKDGWEVKHA